MSFSSRFLALLLVIFITTPACSNRKTAGVVVEMVSDNDTGVALEPITAKQLPAPVDDHVFTNDPAVAADQGSKYYFVSNEAVQEAVKLQLGEKFSKIADIYQSAINNKKSFSHYPELNVVYAFKAEIGEKQSGYIRFPLSEVFAGHGAIIHVAESGINSYWGPTKLYSGFDDSRVLLADLSNLSANTQLFMHGSHYYGFKAESAGKVFGIEINQNKFELRSLATSLPSVGGAARVKVVRVSPAHTAKLGAVVALNSTLYFFADAKGALVHLYHLDKNFIFKEISGKCSILQAAKLLPDGINCGSSLSKN